MDTLKAKGLMTNYMEHSVLIEMSLKAENEEPWCEMSEREETPVIVTKTKIHSGLLNQFHNSSKIKCGK